VLALDCLENTNSQRRIAAGPFDPAIGLCVSNHSATSATRTTRLDRWATTMARNSAATVPGLLRRMVQSLSRSLTAPGWNTQVVCLHPW